MLKGFRRKVMQIANRLVGQGYIRACAMKTAWKLIKAHAVSTKVVGTSFDNNSLYTILILIPKNPIDIEFSGNACCAGYNWLRQLPSHTNLYAAFSS